LIEATGALYRAASLGGLSQLNARRALDRLAQLEKRWTEIVESDRVRDIAIDVLRMHHLQAGDAIQLSSALVWCKEKARRRWFVCFDEKLGAAAQSVGFEVLGAGE
jgi:predicted nucleic acid-binding protein